jgi:hypothetical protein
VVRPLQRNNYATASNNETQSETITTPHRSAPNRSIHQAGHARDELQLQEQQAESTNAQSTHEIASITQYDPFFNEPPKAILPIITSRKRFQSNTSPPQGEASYKIAKTAAATHKRSKEPVAQETSSIPSNQMQVPPVLVNLTHSSIHNPVKETHPLGRQLAVSGSEEPSRESRRDLLSPPSNTQRFSRGTTMRPDSHVALRVRSLERVTTVPEDIASDLLKKFPAPPNLPTKLPPDAFLRPRDDKTTKAHHQTTDHTPTETKNPIKVKPNISKKP